jgi:DNA-binding NarL/FixJ family response regulator
VEARGEMTRPTNAAIAESPHQSLGDLTPAQLRVLERVNSGLLNKQIAFDLGIAEATVKAHMTAVMRKLNVHNRTQAAIAAQGMIAKARATTD